MFEVQHALEKRYAQGKKQLIILMNVSA